MQVQAEATPMLDDLTRAFVKRTLGAGLVELDDIKKVVSDYFKIQMKDLNSSRRNREIARPRQIAIWLCKELTTNSLPEIGKKFNRDHTTVLHAINRVEEMISSDDKISNDILSLKRHIK